MKITPRRVYSQAQQDGIIESVFAEIGTTNKVCVEFGFNSLTLEGGTGANSARLVLEDGWTGVYFDGSYENPKINLHQVVLTPENLCEVFAAHDVPKEPDYISIDVDSIDLWLFKAMLAGGYRPRLVSVEYNSNIPLDQSLTVRIGTRWENIDTVYGASLCALNLVAKEFGYNLVAVEPTMDAFFVRGDIVIGIMPLTSFASAITPIHLPATPERLALFEVYPCA